MKRPLALFVASACCALLGQPAVNLQATCSNNQLHVMFMPVSKGRIFARIDTVPPGITWPPSPAFQQIEVPNGTSPTFTVKPGNYLVYVTSLEADGSWPLTSGLNVPCPPPPAPPPVTGPGITVTLDGKVIGTIASPMPVTIAFTSQPGLNIIMTPSVDGKNVLVQVVLEVIAP
jgi:hypothetical protein